MQKCKSEALLKAGSLTQEEALQFAIQNGMINLDEITRNVENMRREAILAKHPYSIWQNEEGLWLTYLPDEKKGRVFRKRKTKEALEDMIVEFYKTQDEQIFLKDVFNEWVDGKLSYGEIQKQSYDRYQTDFKRFFPNSAAICRKQVKNITEEDLIDFIKVTIRDQKLTRKTYGGLRLLIRGIFKYAKMKKYTTLSMDSFFGDLILPNNLFTKKHVNQEEEVFSEEEIDRLMHYLRNHISIWNLGLLLQFETGMRIGEIAALKPEDIGDNCIHVRRTEIKYKDENDKWIVEVRENAKTEAGNRTVYLPESSIWTLHQIQKLNPNGEYLFMNNGKRIRENTFNKRLTRICDELGMKVRSTHKIRKTYGTTLIDNNVDESIIMQQLGHSDISTTKKYYYFGNKSSEKKREQIRNAISY